jgi:hypothetical protein
MNSLHCVRFSFASLLGLSLGLSAGAVAFAGCNAEVEVGGPDGNDAGADRSTPKKTPGAESSVSTGNDAAGCVDFEPTASELTCTTDDDCALVRTGAACPGNPEEVLCDGVANSSGAARIDSELAAFPWGHDAGGTHNFCDGLAGTPRCVARQCTQCGPGKIGPAGCFDAGADAHSDARSGDAGQCGANTVTFDLKVNATGLVFLSGPWPDSFGCPWWLSIAPATSGAALNLVSGGCGMMCPAFQPQPAADQTYTWDGTYYPAQDSSDAGCTEPGCQCRTPVCAAPGDYLAAICVGYDRGEAGAPETSPPTCKIVPFTWPPTTTNQTFVETITPMPDGG